MDDSQPHLNLLSKQPCQTGHFRSTRWSLVLQSSHVDERERREAAETLSRIYWYPLYAFVRRLGHSPHDSEDLTQEFFVRFIQRGDFGKARQLQGRLRSYLIGAMKHFLANEREKRRALKRGGGAPLVSIDQAQAEAWYGKEPVDLMTPEKLYERRWALTLLHRVLNRAREEYASRGKEEVFGVLERYLTWNSGEDYESAAESLHMKVGAVKVAVYRLRKRYRELMLDEIAQTVGPDEDLQDEMMNLFQALS